MEEKTIVEKVINCICIGACCCPYVRTQYNLRKDMNLGDLDIKNIVKEVEKEFDITIDDEMFAKIQTVQDLLEVVSRLLHAKRAVKKTDECIRIWVDGGFSPDFELKGEQRFKEDLDLNWMGVKVIAEDIENALYITITDDEINAVKIVSDLRSLVAAKVTKRD